MEFPLASVCAFFGARRFGFLRQYGRSRRAKPRTRGSLGCAPSTCATAGPAAEFLTRLLLYQKGDGHFFAHANCAPNGHGLRLDVDLRADWIVGSGCARRRHTCLSSPADNGYQGSGRWEKQAIRRGPWLPSWFHGYHVAQ